MLTNLHALYREEEEWYSAIWKHVVEAFGKDHKEFEDFVEGTLECMRKFRDNVGFCAMVLSLTDVSPFCDI